MVEPDEPDILVRGVSHEFAHPALVDIDLRVPAGEFVSIVGPSGCGKTTLLNMIAGFIRPQHGEIWLRGDRVSGVPYDKVAYMFARDTLLPWRTAVRNVELAMEMRGKKVSRNRADELLETVGLSTYASYYPRQLSQGMRQRVAIARTLAVGAGIWLLDEPFGALDPGNRALIHAEFTRIWENTRSSVLLVTHDLSEAIVLSDRVVVMSASPGRVKASYDIELPRPRHVLDLYSDPAFATIFARLWDDLRAELSGSAS
jgi:NitT/TauT family transport system ATP-binding protein